MRGFEIAVKNWKSRGEPACSPLLRIRVLLRVIQTQRALTYLAPR